METGRVPPVRLLDLRPIESCRHSVPPPLADHLSVAYSEA